MKTTAKTVSTFLLCGAAVLATQDGFAAGRADTDDQPAQSSVSTSEEGRGTDPEIGGQETAEDDELRQLLAETESALAIAGGGGAERQEALRLAIENLRDALEERMRTLEDPELAATEESDQGVAEARGQLEEAVSETMEEDYDEEGSNDVPAPAPRPLQQLAGALDSSLQIIERIQEIRAALRGVREEEAYGRAAEQPWQEDIPDTDAGDMEAEGDEYATDVEALQEVSGVITEDGVPIADAVVTESELGLSASTDEHGVYTLRGVPARMSGLIVSKAGKTVARGRIEVARGRVAVADFELHRKALGNASLAASALRVVPSQVTVTGSSDSKNVGTIEGVVLASSGKPAPRAVVRLGRLAVARTDSHGRFVFRRVPAGMHEVTVAMSGGSTATQRISVEPTKAALSAIHIAASTKTPAPVAIAVRKDAKISLYGVVSDASNRPVSGARVTVALSTHAVVVRTQAEGEYKVRGLAPGTYRLVVAKTGFRDATSTLRLGSGTSERRDFRLVATTSPVVLKTIERRSATLGEIRGQVRGPGHAALAGVKVSLVRGTSPATTAATQTDSGGNFMLRVEPGTWELRAAKKGFRTATSKVTLRARGLQTESVTLVAETKRLPSVPGRATPVPVASAKPAPTRIPRTPASSGHVAVSANGRKVTGHVVDAATGRPIADATVILLGTTHGAVGKKLDRTDTHGSFAIPSTAPGDYLIRVEKKGYETTEKALHLNNDRDVKAELRLRRVESPVLSPTPRTAGKQLEKPKGT